MISDMQQSFKGAGKRLQLDENKSRTANKSSLKGTCLIQPAVRECYSSALCSLYERDELK